MLGFIVGQFGLKALAEMNDLTTTVPRGQGALLGGPARREQGGPERCDRYVGRRNLVRFEPLGLDVVSLKGKPVRRFARAHDRNPMTPCRHEISLMQDHLNPAEEGGVFQQVVDAQWTLRLTAAF